MADDKPKMIKVLIETPYAGTPEEIERNVRYVRACIKDCLRKGEAPFASHALYTLPGCLDEADNAQRQVGMKAGFAWGEAADVVAIYTDIGITRGMKSGITRATNRGQKVEYRRLGGEWTKPDAV
jgi:hypothetical protein